MRSLNKVLALLLALMMTAAACGSDAADTADDAVADSTDDSDAADTADDAVADATDSTDDMVMFSGELVGAGASSQKAAMDGWLAGYSAIQPDLSVSYDPIGSGGGREQFLSGGSNFAGSDAYLKDDEITASMEVCENPEGAVSLPHYISPIAVAYNLPGVEGLNLTTEALASIMAGVTTNWTDPLIADANPDLELPDLAINPVHRSDESGTSENFTDYLAAVQPDIWTVGAIEVWPSEYGGEGADGTSGVVAAIGAGEGSIGYADASQVGSLGVANVQVGEEFVAYSPEAAAKIVDVSERVEGRSEYDFAINLTRDTTEAGVYPIALVSYHIVCLDYADDEVAAKVKDFMTYISSPEGQAAAQSAAGSAPISDDLRDQMAPVIESIQ